ncbi:AT-rich interactive domain-containing protein 2 [Halotydeus destructor]|nr:AT-rich interactive domain-containing protein 2 [Halotydeus destructor]
MSFNSTVKSQQFVSELAQFYRNKGQIGISPQHLVARLNGQPVNLWELYSVVLEMGGSYRVNASSLWDEVYTKLCHSQPPGANVAVALRQIYQRLLMPYERVNLTSFSNDVIDKDDDDVRNPNAKELANSFVLHSSFSSTQSHHNHLYHQQVNSDSTYINPHNKLFCALLSGLPNEMDVGLRITEKLLGSKETDCLADFKFIEVLLDCCTMYACSCNDDNSDLQANPPDNSDNSNAIVATYCMQSLVSSPPRCLCLQKFWSNMCKDSSVMDIVFAQESSPSNCRSGEEFQLQDQIHRKVHRIAEIIKILSFSLKHNASEEPQAAPLSLLRFVGLLLASKDAIFTTISLDIISNTILQMSSPRDCEEYTNLQQFIYKFSITLIQDSNDVHCLNRVLEVITKLMNSGNEEVVSYITRLLDEEIHVRLIELLTCQHDVSLVISTLEFCLALSEQYPKLLLRENNHLIRALIYLLNCEASQHFNSTALSKVKVCDAKLPQQAPVVAVPISVPVAAVPQSPLRVLTTPQTPQPSHVHANLDNESFAFNWLKSTFDVVNGARPQAYKLNEIYQEYMNYSGRSGRRNVVDVRFFTALIKKAFSTADINAAAAIVLVEGICPKVTPAKPAALRPGQLASPILKAHLSAPPRGPSSPPPVTNSPVTPTVSNTSTLIKTLLASKLRNNATASSQATTPNIVTISKSESSSTKQVIKVEQNIVPKTNGDIANELKSTVMSSPVKKEIEIKQEKTVIVSKQQIHTENGEPKSTGNTVSVASNAITVISSAMSTTPTFSVTQSGMNQQQVIIGQVPNAQIGQAPQQYLLVRTIVGGQQQQGLVSVPAGQGQIRLILPSNMLTQQRPMTISSSSINGLTLSSQSHPVTQATISNIMNQSQGNTNQSQSNDILLKAVLGSGIGLDSPPSPPSNRSNTPVKSSPLLNVLLDKGKLPEYSAGVSQPANVITTSSNAMTVNCVQQPKMFILTTKTGVPIKTIQPISQTANVQSQVIQAQSLQNSIQAQTIINSIQKPDIIEAHPQKMIVNHVVSSPTVTNAATPPKSNPLTNGDIQPSSMTSVDEVSVKKPSATSDLSPLKDIQKAMDDATKLLSKRGNEQHSDSPLKKIKLNNSSPVTSTVKSISPKSTLTNGEALPSKVIEIQPEITRKAPSSAKINPVTAGQQPKPLEFRCEWNSCGRLFLQPSQVFKHVYDEHVMVDKSQPLTTNMTCEWGGPGGLGPGCQSKRPKFSLLAHIQDFHCNALLLKQLAIRSQQLGKSGSTNLGLPQPPPAHPGYAQNAAMLAIKRHAVGYVEPPTIPTVTPTTPITISIRLTAALILRNLAEHSSYVKKSLQSYEPMLSELCVNEIHESRTLAQCLAILFDKKSCRS